MKQMIYTGHMVFEYTEKCYVPRLREAEQKSMFRHVSKLVTFSPAETLIAFM